MTLSDDRLFAVTAPSKQRLNRDWLPAKMAPARVPAVSVAVIDQGEVMFAEAWGVREMGRPAPATPDSLFQAASMVKPVVSFAALRLVARGELDLDADVGQ